MFGSHEPEGLAPALKMCRCHFSAKSMSHMHWASLPNGDPTAWHYLWAEMLALCLSTCRGFGASQLKASTDDILQVNLHGIQTHPPQQSPIATWTRLDEWWSVDTVTLTNVLLRRIGYVVWLPIRQANRSPVLRTEKLKR